MTDSDRLGVVEYSTELFSRQLWIPNGATVQDVRIDPGSLRSFLVFFHHPALDPVPDGDPVHKLTPVITRTKTGHVADWGEMLGIHNAPW